MRRWFSLTLALGVVLSGACLPMRGGTGDDGFFPANTRGETFYVVYSGDAYGFITYNTDGTRVHGFAEPTLDPTLADPGTGWYELPGDGTLEFVTESGQLARTLSVVAVEDLYRIVRIDPPTGIAGGSYDTNRYYWDRSAAEGRIAELQGR